MTNRIVKWNVERKERKDRERGEEKVKKLIGKIYSNWKLSIKGKNLGNISPSECIAQLRVDVMNALSEAGLDAYQEFTENLLNDVYSRTRQAEVLGTLSTKTVDKSMPNQIHIGGTSHPFHVESELYELEEVQSHMKREGFAGVVLKGRTLLAVHVLEGSKLEFEEIGQVRTGKGLDRIPSKKQFLAAAGQTEEE